MRFSTRYIRLISTLLLLAYAVPTLAVGSLAQSPGTTVRGFGCIGDGVTQDTLAVQRAIDACASGGGGTIVFPSGVYLCGSLHLHSNCTLRLEAGATIKGIREIAAYDPPETLGFKNASDQETSFFHHALIWGEDLEHVAIVGEGTIDANFVKRHGPKPIALKRCRFVKIEGITIRNAPNYNISLLGDDFVVINGVTILNGYADGIDPDSCRNVRISNCHIESQDDAIVLKTSFSLGAHRSCENVTVTNCSLATTCYCFKLGTESGSDFKQIAISNCVMTGMAGDSPASGGVAIESVDGANIAGVAVSNLSMNGVRSPVYMRLGNRGRDLAVKTPGTLRDVCIDNIVAENASLVCTLAGIPGHPIEDVSLSNIRIAYCGSAMLRSADSVVPENIDAYPDDDMFGPLPSDGFYMRHVNGFRLTNVQLQPGSDFWRLAVVDDRQVDWKPVPPTHSKASHPESEFVCEDVSGLVLDGTNFWRPYGEAPAVRLIDVSDMVLRNCNVADNTKVFMVKRGNCRRIRFVNNVLNGAKIYKAKIQPSTGP